MKISKVNHTKTAVGINQEKKQPEGILYVDPARNGEATQELSSYVNRRGDDTKILYSVLQESKDPKEDSKKEMFLIRSGNSAFKKALKSSHFTMDILLKEMQNEASFLLDKRNYQATEEDIKKVVSTHLRKSLQRQENACENMIRLFCAGFCKKALNAEEKKELEQTIIQAVINDYQKSSIKKHTPKALINQNMVVQPQKKGDDQVYLSVSMVDSTDRKKKEKEALRAFLLEYATLDEDKRSEFRRKLRRMIDLYFYGMGDVPKESFNEWQDHKDHQGRTDIFVSFSFQTDLDKKAADAEKKRLKELIRKENIASYRKCMELVKNDQTGLFFEQADWNEFWVHHIENEVERIYGRIGKNTAHKLEKGYLSEKVWKGILNYLCGKYLAIGKAVYQYAMSDLTKKGDIVLGKISPEVLHGISSFQYEQIKAEETLQRETSVAVAFAVNHIANATVDLKDKEDFLSLKKEELESARKMNCKRNILQYFGGQSRWNNTPIENVEEGKILEDFQSILFSMRNENFHFVTESHNAGGWDQALIGEMFGKDASDVARIQKDKLYSNNLPMFYDSKDLEKTLHRLYDHYAPRASQVPSFNAVFVRKNYGNVLKDEFKIQANLNDDDRLKWQSALYYLMKELYYNAFLQEEDAKKRFMDAVKSMTATDEKEERALKNFQGRLRDFDGSYTLSQICQLIMTEYNQQNSGQRKKKSDYAKKDQEIYKHFKMLLMKSLRMTFERYLEQEEYSFLKKPRVREKCAAEDFLSTFESGLYASLFEKVKKEPILQKWYVVGRLLNPKQANQLVGALRHYEQYSWDVHRRAKETGNPIQNTPQRDEEVKQAIEVLDLCIRLSGATSNQLTDYFTDEDDYADYVKNFLKYEDNTEGYEISSSTKLKEFCSQEISNGNRIGIFYDGSNPILNRNIIWAKLYGSDRLLKNAIRPVTKQEIEKSFDLLNKISGYQKTGECNTIEEQKNVKLFQDVKNRIEFRSVTEYTELIDDLHGQLINWVYLRERDLLYYQLGFHYLCLQNHSEKPETYVTLDTEDGKIENAILYQIAAMYIYGIPVYYKDENGKTKKNTGQTGVKIPAFLKYTKLSGDPAWFYNAGLELFENVKEHDDIIDLRNYIEHFHYYSSADRSLLSLYSEVFDRFFTYDMKYQKNVANMMYNILLSHFVIPKFVYGTGEKVYANTKKECARIQLAENDGVCSDRFTYKKAAGGGFTAPARGDDFLKDVARILYYPEAAPESIVKSTEVKELSKEDDKQASMGSKKYQGDKRKNYGNNDKKNYGYNDKKNRGVEKVSDPIGTSMADLLKRIKVDR